MIKQREIGNKLLVIGGAGLVGGAFTYKAITSRLNEDLEEIVITNYAKNSEESKDGIATAVEKLSELRIRLEKTGELEWTTTGQSQIKAGIKIKGYEFNLIPPSIMVEGRNIKIEDTPIYKLIEDVKPAIIVNSVPVATAVSYNNGDKNQEGVKYKGANAVLIEYLRSLHKALSDFEVKTYVKIGTTGVGGMGYNIPFSHGESGRPGNPLLLKSSLGFAESGIYELWGKDGNLSTEIIDLKPAAALGYDRVDVDKIKPLNRYKLPTELAGIFEKNNAFLVCKPVELKLNNPTKRIEWDFKEILRAPYLRSGENGQFSLSEWLALTRPGLMELVSGEEIAEIALREVLGVNTGYNYTITKQEIKPTFSAAYIREAGARLLREVGGDDTCQIFLNLGPERLSKLIFESYLIREALKKDGKIGTLEELAVIKPEELQRLVLSLLRNNNTIDQMISVGIPIYTGNSVLSGPFIAMPDMVVDNYASLDDKLKDPDAINENCIYCWVDLRPGTESKEISEPKTRMYTGLGAWIKRANEIVQEAEVIKDYAKAGKIGSAIGKRALWLPYLTPEKEITISPGELAGWVLDNEEKGGRYQI